MGVLLRARNLVRSYTRINTRVYVYLYNIRVDVIERGVRSDPLEPPPWLRAWAKVTIKNSFHIWTQRNRLSEPDESMTTGAM